ncbi:unnamed protein product [Cuscuta europaea]|uniref:Uncharacterized protein n=1 Tax=Cuscuta europaea TaxID=41803 RepID=A0A9P0ZIX3_CUSEU|nr:unnamed protein product [Cuscuta europaea]
MLCSTSSVVLDSMESRLLSNSTTRYIDHGYFGPRSSVSIFGGSVSGQSVVSPIEDVDISYFDDSDADDEFVDYDALPAHTSRRAVGAI